MSPSILKRYLMTLVVMLMLPLISLAQQASGTIEGIIKDTTGAVIAGAEVVVTNTETGASRTFQTGEGGLYNIPSLTVGKYAIKVTAQGFAPKELGGIVVTVGSVVGVNVDLTVGETSGEIVNVSADAPLVETTRTQISTTVDERAIKDLPVNGRSFLDFVLLTPGVNSDPRSGDVSFGGLRGTNNSLQIDGADNNNSFFGQSLGRSGSGRAPYQFSKDAVKEFQVNTNTYSAEYGRAGGAVINVVTRSGTNEYHGSGFIFLRDRSLNALEPFAKALKRPKARNRFYQFGAILSGPIVKDKAFFFFNYDGQRNSEPNPVFFGTAVPTDAVSKAVAASLTPFLTTYQRQFNQDVFLGKVDYQLNNRDRLSVRYNHQKFNGTNLENSGNQSVMEHTGDALVMSDTLTANLTSVLTPRVVNDLRFQFARDDEPGQANGTAPEATIRNNGITFLTIGRNSFSPRATNIKRYQFIDSLSYSVGSHAFKFGVDANIERIENFFPGNFSGVYTFNSLSDFGNRITGSFTQNFPGAGTSGALSRPDVTEVSFYAQDDFRATPRLKFYYGIRYDAQRIKEPMITNKDFQLAQRNINTGQVNQDNNNFGPRVGFSYAATKDNKTVIRAGYGVFYSRTPAILAGTVITNNGIQIQSFTLSGSAAPKYPNILSTPPAAGKQNIFFYDTNFVQPLVQQASVGVERELIGGIGVSVSYLLVKGTHLARVRDINLGPQTNTSIPIVGAGASVSVPKFGTRPLSNFNKVSMVASDSNSIYHGLSLQVTKRYAHNFQFLFSYTFSKGIDDKPDSTAVVIGADDAKFISDPTRPDLDRGPGDSDVRHRAVISGVYDINLASKFNKSSGIAKAILDNYSLSGIYTLTSGRAFNATIGAIGVNPDLNNDGNSRTDRFPGVGRNTVRGPNFYQLDLRLAKGFKPTEATKIEFIGEAFNIMNRTNVATINTNPFNLTTAGFVRNSLFGAPLSTTGAARGANRQFQLALRFEF